MGHPRSCPCLGMSCAPNAKGETYYALRTSDLCYLVAYDHSTHVPYHLAALDQNLALPLSVLDVKGLV